MQRTRGYGLIPGLVVGVSLGLLPVVADVASAQDIDIDAENCSVAIFCQSADSESRGGNAHGGRGGNGGFASVHDVANAVSAASSNVIVGDISTGDAVNSEVNDDDVSDAGVVLGGGGAAQRGTTGGDGVTVNEAGGDGGGAHGGKGGDRHADQARLVILP